MGIPLGGLGLVELNEGLNACSPTPDACWINRGDLLLTYDFRSYQNEKPPFFGIINDPIEHQTFEIISPISGLLLSTRDEKTVAFTADLQYQWDTEKALPVILVPNDEPSPVMQNFYEYDKIARFLSRVFNLIPVRDYANVSPQRLRDFIDGSGNEKDKFYTECLTKLRERNSENHKTYEIREISDKDYDSIRNVQEFRGKDLRLRDKLVHIARKYGDSI